MTISGPKFPLLYLLVFVIMFSAYLPNSNKAHVDDTQLMAGVAKENITPITPITMSGYGGRTDPFHGIHDSLYVTATVFGNGADLAAIITADLIGFSHENYEDLQAMIVMECGIAREHILITANHNHGGPTNKTYAKNVDSGIEDYVNMVNEKILTAVKKAKKNQQPAMIGVGKGICKMNINRRARFADGNIWLGRNPDGPCDHELTVLRIDDLKHNPIAFHVNWPCHATASGQQNQLITGDWPGLAARHIEEQIAPEVVVAVTAGASADINPIYGPNDNFREIEALGMLVGEKALEIALTIQTQPGGNIDGRKMTIDANGKKPFENREPNQKLESAKDVVINLSALKVGPVIFAGISGELMTEIGMRIKEESPYKNTLILTHCNGSSGYLCTNQAYLEGGYEAMVSRVMPGTEYLISENLKDMIISLK